MSDPREQLQGLFAEAARFNNFGDAIIKMQIQGFRCHSNTTIEIRSPITAFCGLNGTGKSTIIQLAASAYKKTPDCGRYYIGYFIKDGTLDASPFAPNVKVVYEYLQGPDSHGVIRNKIVTISRKINWSGYPRQPQRRVYYAGISLYLPRVEELDFVTRNARKLVVQNTNPLSPDLQRQVSCILGTAYTAAQNNTVTLWGRSQSVVTVKRDDSNYSEINMGYGEARIHNLVRDLANLPDRSLVLLEEPEISLHPSAQHELGKHLVDVVLQKRHQIMLTTHSEYILRSLHSHSRVFLHRTSTGIKQIPGVGVDQAASLLADQHKKALHILVEDDVAVHVVTELLRKHDPMFLKTIRITIGGDKQQIQRIMVVLREMGVQVCAVRDADVGANPKENLFKLPGTNPPEMEIFSSQTFRQLLADKFGLNVDDFAIKMGSRDHHEWFAVLADVIPYNYDALLQLAAETYLQSVPEGERVSLVNQLKAAVK